MPAARGERVLPWSRAVSGSHEAEPETPPRVVRRGLDLARDGWKMIGLTIALFFVFELGFRLQRTVRAALRGSPPAPPTAVHPYAGQAWYQDFEGPEGLQSREHRYDPYRAFWAMPLSSRFITIDSMGLRVTPQPAYDPATARKVFMLGGSVMWGYTARDTFTIPALTAHALAGMGVRDVEIRNLAQRAFNATQESNTLTLELAHGRVPDVAVFLHGFNDMMTAVKYGKPGFTYGQDGVQRFIDLGTRGFWQELVGLGRHSAVVQRLSETIRPAQDSHPKPGAEILCSDVAGYYRNVTRSIEALGREYGFTPIFLLQPVHSTTRKKLTAWERSLPISPFVHRCAAVIDSAMNDRRGISFFSLTSIFDAETATVFVDRNAHLTEAANAVVARRIAEILAPVLNQ